MNCIFPVKNRESMAYKIVVLSLLTERRKGKERLTENCIVHTETI